MNHKVTRTSKSAEMKDTPELAQARSHLAYASGRIKILDARLGTGVGAKRERERLASVLNHSRLILGGAS